MPDKKSPVEMTSANSATLVGGVSPNAAPGAAKDGPGSTEPEKLATSAANTELPPRQPNAAYLPTGEVSPTPAPAGEPGIMPKEGQGTPYEEGELEALKAKEPGGENAEQ